MSTAIANPGGKGTRLHCEGASEIVVKMCSKMMKTDEVDFKRRPRAAKPSRR